MCCQGAKIEPDASKTSGSAFAIGYWFTRSGLSGCVVCGSKRIVLFGGVGFLAGLPVHSLVVAGTIHCVDLAVLVDVGQAPGDIVDGGENQVLVQEVSLGLGKCSVACISVVNDGTALVHQIGELLIGSHQLGLVAGGTIVHNACDVGHVAAVVSVVIVNDDLGQEVDGIIGNDTYRALMQKEMPPNRSGRSAAVRNVIRAAYSVLGTPYVFGGTSTYGFDCSGFTQYAFARAGISIPRMADSQLYYGRQISMSELRPGDLIFFSTYEPGASHCGIYLGDGKFIHAGTSTGVVVADAFTGYWGERYYGACRVL